MMRKLISLLLCLLLLIQVPVLALAEETASAAVRAAYWTSGELHIFSHFLGAEDPETVDVSLMFNNQVVSETKPVLLKNSDATAHYLLLIDNSVSMGQHRSQMFSFVREALKDISDNTRISVAFFDKGYQMVASDLDSWSDVRSAMWKSTNHAEETDICGAAAWALEVLGDDPGTAGDMTNLVILTDGQPLYSGNQKAEKAAEAAQNAAAMMTAYPEITVHTVCFGSWNSEAEAALSAGNGLHLNVNSSSDAAAAGEELAAYMDELCTLTFPLRGYDSAAVIADSLILCVGVNLTTLGTVRNTGMEPAVMPAADVPEEETEPTGEETEPTEEATDPIQEETEPTEGVPEDTQPVPPAGGAEETVSVEDTVSGTDETAALTEEPAGEAVGCPGWVTAIVVAAAAVLLLAVVLVFLKKARAPKDSVRMRVEILSGNVLKLKKVYFLTDQLLIGTDKRCGVVIDDPGAIAVNTRIFKQGQMIYIEDMDSPGGTMLGGMRLYSSNRLRSGDEVTIGTVTLRILF